MADTRGFENYLKESQRWRAPIQKPVEGDGCITVQTPQEIDKLFRLGPFDGQIANLLLREFPDRLFRAPTTSDGAMLHFRSKLTHDQVLAVRDKIGDDYAEVVRRSPR